MLALFCVIKGSTGQLAPGKGAAAPVTRGLAKPLHDGNRHCCIRSTYSRETGCRLLWPGNIRARRRIGLLESHKAPYNSWGTCLVKRESREHAGGDVSHGKPLWVSDHGKQTGSRTFSSMGLWAPMRFLFAKTLKSSVKNAMAVDGERSTPSYRDRTRDGTNHESRRAS
jgi:hypothetical protein